MQWVDWKREIRCCLVDFWARIGCEGLWRSDGMALSTISHGRIDLDELFENSRPSSSSHHQSCALLRLIKLETKS